MSVLHVVFRVGDAEYAVAAADVLQMESYGGATHVPGTPDWVAGVVQIRGQVVPVVDLRARLGLPRAAPALDQRVVVLQVAGRAVGLLVDAAREVLRIAPEQVRPAPGLVAAREGGFVNGIAQVGNRLLLLLAVERVVGEEGMHAEQRT